MYCRIDLSKTNYNEISSCKLLTTDDFCDIITVYEKYCNYKEFRGVRPIFIEDIIEEKSDALGYFYNDKLVAFSFIIKYQSQNSVIADQFAWDYETPSLKLGYKSLRSECARYKRLGYTYFYLGDYYEYKAELKGFEVKSPF